MKRFVRLVLLYSSPFLAGLLIVFLHSTTVNEQKLTGAYAGEISSYSWATQCGPIEGLVLGSSSLRYGLSATGISDSSHKWLNFSYDARDPVVMYLLLKNYYPVLRPKQVIVGLDPWIYTKNYYPYRNKIMYLDLNGEVLIRFLRKDVNAAIKKLQIFGRDVAGRYKARPQIGNKQLQIPSDYGSVKLDIKAVNFEADKDWFELERTGWSDVQFEYLKKLNVFCKTNGINVVYVFPPKRNDFIAAAREKFPKENSEWWARINAAITGAKVLGAYDVLSTENQQEIFAEAYHLNGVGQEKYSAYVRRHLGDAEVISLKYQYISKE
jgi:hypothetical protein